MQCTNTKYSLYDNLSCRLSYGHVVCTDQKSNYCIKYRALTESLLIISCPRKTFLIFFFFLRPMYSYWTKYPINLSGKNRILRFFCNVLHTDENNSLAHFGAQLRNMSWDNKKVLLQIYGNYQPFLRTVVRKNQISLRHCIV